MIRRITEKSFNQMILPNIKSSGTVYYFSCNYEKYLTYDKEAFPFYQIVFNSHLDQWGVPNFINAGYFDSSCYWILVPFFDHGGFAAMTCGLCPHYPGKAWITSELRSDHGETMTWSQSDHLTCGLCPHYPGFAWMTSELRSDHGETMTWSLCDHLTCGRNPHRGVAMTSELRSDH
jgi:hypothetical protein